MVERVAGRFQHPHQEIADLDDVAMTGAQIDIGDWRLLVVRSDDAAIVFLLQFSNPADMVVVVMGDQDIGQRPSLALQRLDDWAGFGRIDRSGRPGRGIVDQIAEIVVEAVKGANFRGHGISTYGMNLRLYFWSMISSENRF